VALPQPRPPGQSIYKRRKAWTHIQAPRWVHALVRDGIHIKWKNGAPSQVTRPRPIHLPPHKQAVVNQELTEMLMASATELVQHYDINPDEEEFYITFFAAETGGKLRVVFNLPPLNDHIEDPPSFRHETTKDLAANLLPNDWGVKIDFKKAFWGLRIPRRLRRFFRFMWGGRKYQLAAMPLGLKTAPYLFHAVTAAVVKRLRQKGIRLVYYVDDLVVLHQDRETALEHAQTVIDLFDELGFVISHTKTATVPAQEFEFLGLIFNTKTLTTHVPTGSC